jgi:hypothetical protein
MHRLVQFHAIARPSASAPTDPMPWDGEPHRRGTYRPSCCTSCAQPSPSTPAPPPPAGSAYGTATAGCMAAPRWVSWGVAAPSPSHQRSLPRCWMDPASGFWAATTSCSPVHWRQHRARLGQSPQQLHSPLTQPVLASRPRLVRRLRDRPVLHRTLVAGSESLAQALVDDPRLETWRVQQQTPSRSTATRSTPNQQPKRPIPDCGNLLERCCCDPLRPPSFSNARPAVAPSESASKSEERND